MGNYQTGLLIKNTDGKTYLIEYGKKRLIPDEGTLNALTLNLGSKLLIAPPDNTFDTIPTGQAFTSLVAFIRANPQLVPYIYNVVYKLIPPGGIVKLSGGMAFIANAVANMYAAAIANPNKWGNPAKMIPNSKANAKPQIDILAQAINAVLKAVFQQFGVDASSAEKVVDDSVDDTGDSFANDSPTPTEEDSGCPTITDQNCEPPVTDEDPEACPPPVATSEAAGCIPPPQTEEPICPAPTSEDDDCPPPTTEAAGCPAPTTEAAGCPAPTTEAAGCPAPTTEAAGCPAPTTEAAGCPAPTTEAAGCIPQSDDCPTDDCGD